MREEQLKDDEILKNSFYVALDRATPDEKEQIKRHISLLNNSPDDKNVIEACAGFYTRIHHLLIGSNFRWRVQAAQNKQHQNLGGK